VVFCIEKGLSIDELSLEELQSFAPEFDSDIYDAISLETCVNKRLTTGAPGKEAIEDEIERCKEYLIVS
jgi:argininosuccinate lyase